MSLRPGKRHEPCKGKGCPDCQGRGWLMPIKKPRSRLKPKSAKQAVEDRTYSHLRKLFVTSHPFCQRCKTAPSCDIHHKAGRGKNHNNVATWAAVCRQCHEWIHQHPNQARQDGFLE